MFSVLAFPLFFQQNPDEKGTEVICATLSGDLGHVHRGEDASTPYRQLDNVPSVPRLS